MARAEPDGIFTWLDVPPTARQSWSAAVVAVVVLVALVALAPIAGRPLTQLNALFPSLDAIVVISDLITAVLLFAQFAISRSRAFLALACGYLFTAMIVVPHALTFSGAFSPTGLLGAGIQTGSWLFIFWHIGFAAGLLAYAVFKEGKQAELIVQGLTLRAIGLSVASVFVLVSSLTWLATSGETLLPPIILDESRISPIVIYPISFAILINVVALVVIFVRRHSLLDQWLMVVAVVSLAELTFSGLLPAVRFSVGFYAGRVFALITSSIILIVLLAETTALYVRLARSNSMLRRERDSKLMSMEAIAASISHEVRQPLGAISANGEAALLILEDAAPNLEEARTALNAIINDSCRASQVFDSMRTLLRGTGQKNEPINVNEIVREVLRILRGELEEHRVTTRTDLAPGMPVLMGNKGQLHEVILNLVQNAVEAMAAIKDGRRILRVKTEHHDQDAIIVAVEDSGPGIDSDKLDGIFDAFVTTKSHGMGLGLAICRVIIERHGGELSAWSDKKRKGAIFQFKLPIKSAAGDPVAL
jgi:signal transduction histidine kinase